MEPKHERKGIPDLADAFLPEISPGELLGALLGAVDAAKVRTKKETIAMVFSVLDELRGKDGCVAVEVFKRVLKDRGAV